MSFGLVGKTLSHSYSQIVHKLIGYYDYDLFSIPDHEFTNFIENGEFSGLNITIPYKERVLDLIPCDETAVKIGAANTIYRKDGELRATNTDLWGFLYLLSLNNITLTNQKVLILGSGGGCKSVYAACTMAGAKKIFIASRKNIKKNGFVTYNTLPTDVDIIVNATPVGTYPDIDKSPIRLSPFAKCHTVIDLIYNPSMTRLLLEAKAMNKKAVNGLSMLVAQATKSAEYFIGLNMLSHNKALIAALRNITENIILIGMPMSGKTSLACEIAKSTGRKLVDMDSLIETYCGKSILRIFEEDGETYFREVESRIFKEIASESGQVIATGGGLILNKENRLNMQSKGLIVHLKKDADIISFSEETLKNRPLLTSKARWHKLYDIRYPLYEGLAHISIDNNKSLKDVTDEMLKKVGKYYEENHCN